MLSQYAAREIATRMVVDRFGFDFELVIPAHKLGFKVKQMPVRWRNEAGLSIAFTGPNGFIRMDYRDRKDPRNRSVYVYRSRSGLDTSLLALGCVVCRCVPLQ